MNRSSRGEFGYGSTVQEYHDSPVRSYRDDPNFGDSASGYQARSAIPQENFSVLSDSISSNIFNISSNASTLERSLKQIGTNKDSIELRNKIHDAEKKTNAVITDTAAHFKQLSAICSKGDRAQRLQMDRLMGEFREVTEKYHSFQKKVAERVKVSSPVQSSVRPSAPKTDLIGWNEPEDDKSQLISEQRKQQVLVQQQFVDDEVALLQEREEQIHQLESDILNINDIFRELGTLVHEQGTVIDSIEQNVETAYGQVEAGTQELQRAASYQNKARKKKLCLLGVVLIIVAIVVIIIVVSVKTKK